MKKNRSVRIQQYDTQKDEWVESREEGVGRGSGDCHQSRAVHNRKFMWMMEKDLQ